MRWQSIRRNRLLPILFVLLPLTIFVNIILHRGSTNIYNKISPYFFIKRNGFDGDGENNYNYPHDPKYQNIRDKGKPADIPPCGDVCELHTVPNLSDFDFNTLNLTINHNPKHGFRRPILTKSFHCPSIMTRAMVNRGPKPPVQIPKKSHVPPRYPPDHLIPAFTMYGRMPIKSKLRYFSNNTYDSRTVRILTRQKMEKMAKNFARGRKVGTYGYAVVERFYGMLKKYKDSGHIPVSSSRSTSAISKGLVIGSQRFWSEMLLLQLGIESLVTLEYANILSQHPQMRILYPHTLAREVMPNLSKGYMNEVIEPLFDVGISYSSLEHCGLGRYGEDLDPFGDLEAMAQAWCLLKPGALFFLNVPFTPDKLGYIEWNAHRVYNWERIIQMAANWLILEYTTDEGDGPNLISKIFVLQKPWE